MSDAICTQVTEILAHAGVTYAAEYRGEKRNALGGNTPMDQWTCVFTRIEGRAQIVEFDYFTGLGHRKAPAGVTRAFDKVRLAKPRAPHPAGVLHSLILDSSAADQSFESWCGDFGYDTDSRKAFATYEACQQNADKLRGFFTRETLESLTSALQDY